MAELRKMIINWINGDTLDLKRAEEILNRIKD